MKPDLEIVAEIHPQHGGSLPVLREMIREAKLAGADSVKLQLYDGAKLLGPDWEYLTLSEADLATVRLWCDQDGIGLSASVFDAERLNWCLKLGLKDLKIASITLRDDRALCERIVSEASRVTISLGHWTQEALPFPVSETLRYLYCKARYPALLEDMAGFPARFSEDHVTGYSDHTLGLSVCLLAIARGATTVEKHMTLAKSLVKRTEKAHICSMTPQELGELRRVGGELYRTLRALPESGAVQ